MSQHYKDKEHKTYRDLGLLRKHKTRLGRESVNREKIYIFIGNGDAERPFRKVPRDAYLEALQRAFSEIEITSDRLDDFRRKQIENEVYDSFISHQSQIEEVEKEFSKLEGRKFSAREKEQYLSMLSKHGPAPTDPSVIARKNSIREVLAKIKEKHEKASPRLQQFWEKLVGPELASRTQVIHIDAEKGTAIVQCLSSSDIFALRKKRNLAKEFSETSGIPLKKMIYR